ncbi:MAG TPA: cytidine deaminase [Puia sp.]|nr:cytidine deaminase [Puia sp.]
MQHKEFRLTYEEYASDAELAPGDRDLLAKAREVTAHAYAPYSRFRVGAAARLATGEVITGTNQENASFPVGICAERVLLSAAASLYPGTPIREIAVSYFNEQGPAGRPIFPCGICRQSLQEFETRTQQPIRLILGGQSGPVYVIPESGSLLPLAFAAGDLA